MLCRSETGCENEDRIFLAFDRG